MVISQGLVGPKRILKRGLDGQMVNIPSPLHTAKGGRSVVLYVTYRLVIHAVRMVFRKIRIPLFNHESKRSGKPAALANGNVKEHASKKSL